MTDSMNFGPDWIRNLSSEGSTGGGTSGGAKYQLAEYRYGREEMLALFDRNSKPPISLSGFKGLYSETSLLPLALLPTSEEERGWQVRPTTLTGPPRGRGSSLERGGRINRGRGTYQYGRPSGYDSGWGNGEQPDWSPRKEYGNQRTMSLDNWRRTKGNEEDDGWRNMEKYKAQQWGRSSSWRGEGEPEERAGTSERGGRSGWSETRGMPARKTWDNEDHLPEWATENPMESGGTFDERGAFHGSDDEQADGKPPYKRETGLHKSTSQQHIINRTQPPPLPSSKSTTSLVRVDDSSRKREVTEKEDVQSTHENNMPVERSKSVTKVPDNIDKDTNVRENVVSRSPPTSEERQPVVPNGPARDMPRPDDRDFERLQEDFVKKLVVDEEVPKHIQQPQHSQQPMGNLEVGSIQPPPNLVAPPIDKWFYQDPQGHMQGPFSHLEMTEWYKAGYFSNQLKVRRHCDERFFLLGELITLCGGANPFQSDVRFPVLKNDVSKMVDPDLLQFQYLSQMAAYKQAQARIMAEPWSAITLQQQELAAQRLIMQQQQVPPDLQYLQQPQAANPLMHMINQMQQANKLPGQGVVDKPPQGLPGVIDPHLQLHMGNIMSMQNRLPTSNIVPNLPAGFTPNHSSNMQPDNISSNIPGLQATGGMPLGGIQNNVPVSIGGSINIQRPITHASVDQIGSSQAEDPISSLLKQLQQQKQQAQQADSLWQQNSFPSNPSPPQWQSQNEMPMSLWDIQNGATSSPTLPQPEKLLQNKTDAIKPEKPKEFKSDEPSPKELKKKKELDDKQAKKDAEEKRRQEQKKMEADKKVAEEKRKREEERIKRELEKVKKEAEDKRMRELEEKRRLKEQRKLEEEAKKKTDEQKRVEEEKLRQELQERESRRHDEEKRLQQEQIRMAKTAPWSQSNANSGMSLTEIQKAEKERRAIDQALQLQRIQEKEYQQQQAQPEKSPGGIQLNWASKPVETRKVKSLAEIQAEEQERLAKQVAESRLQKEKEPAPVTNNAGNIWNSQNLTWSNPPPTSSQWLSSSAGFWDDSSSRQVSNKPSSVTKNNSTSSTLSTAAKQQSQAAKQQQAQKQQLKQQNSKTKKDESGKSNHNNNKVPSTDEFTEWCFKTLSNISTNVDIPTFVTFLRDIESAFDVREYVKEYLGESNATHQFASNFLERRRSCRPRNNAHKDDMCSPAPAITPSLQHSTEFQEVKGKNKKIKKSKMSKVDARILGFNVTSAPDRINVGDRDYGDNS